MQKKRQKNLALYEQFWILCLWSWENMPLWVKRRMPCIILSVVGNDWTIYWQNLNVHKPYCISTKLGSPFKLQFQWGTFKYALLFFLQISSLETRKSIRCSDCSCSMHLYWIQLGHLLSWGDDQGSLTLIHLLIMQHCLLLFLQVSGSSVNQVDIPCEFSYILWSSICPKMWLMTGRKLYSKFLSVSLLDRWKD